MILSVRSVSPQNKPHKIYNRADFLYSELSEETWHIAKCMHVTCINYNIQLFFIDLLIGNGIRTYVSE